MMHFHTILRVSIACLIFVGVAGWNVTTHSDVAVKMALVADHDVAYTIGGGGNRIRSIAESFTMRGVKVDFFSRITEDLDTGSSLRTVRDEFYMGGVKYYQFYLHENITRQLESYDVILSDMWMWKRTNKAKDLSSLSYIIQELKGLSHIPHIVNSCDIHHIRCRRTVVNKVHGNGKKVCDIVEEEEKSVWSSKSINLFLFVAQQDVDFAKANAPKLMCNTRSSKSSESCEHLTFLPYMIPSEPLQKNKLRLDEYRNNIKKIEKNGIVPAQDSSVQTQTPAITTITNVVYMATPHSAARDGLISFLKSLSSKSISKTDAANIKSIRLHLIGGDWETILKGYEEHFSRHVRRVLVYHNRVKDLSHFLENSINASIVPLTLDGTGISSKVFDSVQYHLPFVSHIMGSRGLPCGTKCKRLFFVKDNDNMGLLRRVIEVADNPIPQLLEMESIANKLDHNVVDRNKGLESLMEKILDKKSKGG